MSWAPLSHKIRRSNVLEHMNHIEQTVKQRIDVFAERKEAEWAKKKVEIEKTVGRRDEDDAFSDVSSVVEPLDESDEKEYHEIEIGKCPITSVSVFQNDAAIVTRRGVINVKEFVKEQIVTFTKFCSLVNGDSIRVASAADCVIADVSFISKSEKILHDQTNKNRIQVAIEELQDKKSALLTAKKRLDKEKQFLKDYKSGVITVSNKDADLKKLMDFESMELMSSFLQFCVSEIKVIEEDVFELDELILEIDNQIKKQKELLAQEKPEFTMETIRNVSVTVSTHQEGELALDISYLVKGASWTPIYDVRVNVAEKKMEIVYYGIVSQNTGEDWMNTNISLSTAEPNDSASPPVLSRMYLNLQSKYASMKRAKKKAGFGGFAKMAQTEQMYDYSDDMEDEVYMEKSLEMAAPRRSRKEKKKREIKPVEATSEQGTISTVFHIPRYASIPSDDSPHKLNITLLTFDVELSYYAVPKLDPNAYLKVVTTNNTTFPLIPGDMSVFVDNNFVSSGEMPSCNPNEELSTFLGTDPSIRVNAAPPKRFKETLGLLKNSYKANIERKTTIKNTKQIPVVLIVKDQVPTSDDEKIKIAVTKPKVDTKKAKLSDSVTAEVTMNKEKNLEWQFTLAAGAEVIVDLHYNVSWPGGVYIDTNVL